MSRSAVCIECSRSFSVPTDVGPMPRRCPDCSAAYKKAAANERARIRRTRVPGQSLDKVCLDCETALPWDGKGRPKLRCDPCRHAHNLEMQRIRYAEDVAAAPEAARERWRRGYQRHAERVRDQKLDQYYRKRYRLTRAEVEQLREARQGLCDICKQPSHPRSRGGRLHVDHCHGTGEVRGLLCGHCNTMIGLAREDPAILAAAIEYLKRE